MTIKGVLDTTKRITKINDATLLNTNGTKRINDMAIAVKGLSKEQALLALSTTKVNIEDQKTILIKSGVITKEEAETMAVFVNTTATETNTTAKTANLKVLKLT